MAKIIRQWEFTFNCPGSTNNLRDMRISEAGNILLGRTGELSNGWGGKRGEGKV
jgi:hypothetical protein